MADALQVAREAAVVGGSIISKYYEHGVAIEHKGIVDLVTRADVESEEAITAVIQKAFPGHAILGEESNSADINAEHLWIVDPLDGTTNFAHHIPHFAVSIAYYHKGEAVCGVIFNPIRDNWYTVTRGGGAFENERRVKVTAAQTLNEICVGCGFYYDRGDVMQSTLDAIRDLFHKQIRGIRRMGTASLDLCYVANGSYGGFFEFQLSPWDFAAGRLYVEEAGGLITDCTGAPLPLEKTSVLATTASLQPELLQIVSPHYLASR